MPLRTRRADLAAGAEREQAALRAGRCVGEGGGVEVALQCDRDGDGVARTVGRAIQSWQVESEVEGQRREGTLQQRADNPRELVVDGAFEAADELVANKGQDDAQQEVGPAVVGAKRQTVERG